MNIQAEIIWNELILSSLENELEESKAHVLSLEELVSSARSRLLLLDVQLKNK